MNLKNFKYVYWILLLILIIVDVISTGLIKSSVNSMNNYYLYGMLGFFISGYILYLLLDLGDLAVTNAIWDILSIILISIIGIVYFRETYNIYHITGLFLAFTSLFFINYTEIKNILK
tara:strand:+ start:429 stop:782 length:354 start_codon:yes stop_codon:yes gene_type:complete